MFNPKNNDFMSPKKPSQNVTNNGAYSSPNEEVRLMILAKQKSRKDGLCTIYIELTSRDKISGKRTFKRVATKERIDPKYWSVAFEKVKDSHPNYKTINDRLEGSLTAVKAHIKGTFDAPYRKDLPSELKTFERHFDQKNRKTLIEYLDDYIKHKQANSVRTTWKEYITLKGRLTAIEKHFGTTLYFESINFEFGDNLRSWSDATGLNPNTCKKTFDALKTFLNFYYNDQQKLNFTLSTDFRERKFSNVTGTHEDDPSPLYIDEIEKLKNFTPMVGLKYSEMVDKQPVEKPLTINAQYRIKNLFLLACSTGLRFTDLVTLRKANFVNDTIVIRASKTDKGKSVKTLYIPIIKLSRDILTEIDYDLTKLKLSNQKANLYLTAILKHLAIDTPTIEYSYKMNGDRTEVEKPKFEIISFHSGRDTFITNMLIAGIDHITVMSWSGHTKFETFRKYVRLSENYLKTQHKQANKLFVFKDEQEEEAKKLGITIVKDDVKQLKGFKKF